MLFVEVEDEGLYGSFLSFKGRIFAYVGDGGVFLSVYHCIGDINAVGGKDAVFGEGKVGSRKSQDFVAPPKP